MNTTTDPCCGKGIKPLPVHIRHMILRDMTEVLDIDLNAFDWPWGQEVITERLRDRNTIGKIAERNDRVIAFVIYKLEKTSVEILRVAVHEDYRRCGVGSQVVRDLVAKIGNVKTRRRVNAAVPDDNLAAHLFFRSLGFRCEGIVKMPGTLGDEYLFSFDGKQR